MTSCPKQLIDEELGDCFMFADLFFEGIPPKAGGSTDQANWFLEFAMQMRSDDNRIMAAKQQRN